MCMREGSILWHLITGNTEGVILRRQTVLSVLKLVSRCLDFRLSYHISTSRCSNEIIRI